MRFKRVAVGGTFEVIHVGHEKLLDEAFKMGEVVLIGLTTDEFASEMKGRRVDPYKVREKRLKEFLRKKGYTNYEIVPLRDKYGPAIEEEELEAIVVSEERVSVANEINEIRASRKLKPLRVIVVPIVKAENGSKISASAIKRGMMDRWGRILSK